MRTWKFHLPQTVKRWREEEIRQDERDWEIKVRVQKGSALKPRNWESNQRIVDWIRFNGEEDWRKEKGDFDVETIKEKHLRRKSIVCWSISQERSWREKFRCLTRNWKEKYCWDGNLCCVVGEKWEHLDWKHQVFD